MDSSCQAAEDYYTTDFLYPVQSTGTFHAFVMPTFVLLPPDVSGSSSMLRFGGQITLFRRFDLYYVRARTTADLKRTNRYTYSLNTSSWGFKMNVLPHQRNWCGITLGICGEQSDPGPIYRNGVDLLISPLHEEGKYYCLLATKEIRNNLWLNAGSKWGTVKVGNLKEERAGSSAVGLDYQLSDSFQLSFNVKRIWYEPVTDNWNPSLRITYKPVDSIYLQAHAGYFSSGINGISPVIEKTIPSDYLNRFSEKGQLYYGAELSIQF